jgi:hypothetical protein
MSIETAPEEHAAFETIVGQLEAAWNAMDGSAFAAPFAENADFVTIRGEIFQESPPSRLVMTRSSGRYTREAKTISRLSLLDCCDPTSLSFTCTHC